MRCNAVLAAVPLALAAMLMPAHLRAQNASPQRPLFVRFRPASHGGVTIGAGAGRGFAPAMGSQGYLGIGFRDVSDDRASTLKLKEPRGAEIMHVDHDGPAGQAGLREHDVVLQVNGQAIEGEEQLRRILHEIPAGRSITLVLSRDGQQQTVTTQMADKATVEREAWEQRTTVPEPPPASVFRGNSFFGGAPQTLPSAAPPITAPPDPAPHSLLGAVMLGSSYTGAVVESIGPQLAQFFGSQGGNGLLVRSVDPNSPAALAGLRAGDVVVRANSVIITGINDWYKLVKENKGHQISVVVVRDKQEQTVILIPDAKRRSSAEPPPQYFGPVSPDNTPDPVSDGALSQHAEARTPILVEMD